MRPFLINRSAAVSWPSLMMWALVISMSVSAVICAHVNAPQVSDRQSEGNMSVEQTHYGPCNLCEALCGLEFRVRDGHNVRSEERRVGKECVRSCRFWLSRVF